MFNGLMDTVTPELVNDPELGWITYNCPTCVDLRIRLHAAKEGEPHPVTVLVIFSEKGKHEAATQHTTFGWKFTNKVRKLADEFIALKDESSGFWVDFKARHLSLPMTSGDGGQDGVLGGD